MPIVDPVSVSLASMMLGCTVSTVARHIRFGRLRGRIDAGDQTVSCSEVEQMASQLYPWRRHLEDSDSFWVTGSVAASILGVSAKRLGALAGAGALPFVRHEDGTRLYRRSELVHLSGR